MSAGVLTRPDPTGRSLAVSIGLHGSLVLAFLAVGWINKNGEKLGDPNAGGAAVGVETADKIPLAHSGKPMPLASNSESEAPQAPPKAVEREEKEVVPKDAIKLNLHKEKKQVAKEASKLHKFRSYEQLESNQLTSTQAQAVSSPLFSQAAGSGRIGTGMNTTLGTRFGGYAQQIRELIARNWQTGDVTAQSGPQVIATFELMRDGSIRNLALLQRSGNSSLDFSVRRAIEGVHFPPLPPGFNESSAKCEFTFELKK